jgi:hypothetical protein
VSLIPFLELDKIELKFYYYTIMPVVTPMGIYAPFKGVYPQIPYRRFGEKELF